MIILSGLLARTKVEHERIKHSHEHAHPQKHARTQSLSLSPLSSCNIAEGQRISLSVSDLTTIIMTTMAAAM